MSDQITVRIEGGEEIAAWLKSIGGSAADVLEAAIDAAAEVIEDAAEANAPGPHIERETVKRSREQVEVNVGPDADHWYYRFFETGVQPFEINMNTKRSTRSDGTGRNIHSDKQALASPGGDFFGAVVHRGSMAARPFMRPAYDTEQDTAADAAGDVFSKAMDQVK